MTLYSYTARDAAGVRVRGRMTADSRTSALAALHARSLYVTGIGPWPTITAAALALPFGGRGHRSATAVFFRSLSALAGAGVPIRRSLEIAIEQCANARFREALRSLLSDIENGRSLSEAMMRRPDEFSAVFIAMIRAGELGGMLDEVMERIAALLERDRALRKRAASALAYPAVVACAAVALVFFLLASIVPTFATMYEQMHVPLPAATAALIAAGTLLRSPGTWVLVLTACAGLAAGAAYARSTRSGALLLEDAMLRVPLAGTIVRKSTLGRFARTFGSLLRSGVNIVAALEVIIEAVGSPNYRESLTALRVSLAAGSGVAAPLAESRLFDAFFLQLVRVGEESGALDSMLLRAADYYEADVEAAISTLASLIEPALVVTLGGAVGFIVSAIFIPLYTLIGNIR